MLTLHLIAMAAWVGGALFLTAMGLFLHTNEEEKSVVYRLIGPLYAKVQTVWFILLLLSGSYLAFTKGYNPLSLPVFFIKLTLVAVLAIATIIHTIFAFKALKTSLSHPQKLISRVCSFLILIGSLFVVAFGVALTHGHSL